MTDESIYTLELDVRQIRILRQMLSDLREERNKLLEKYRLSQADESYIWSEIGVADSIIYEIDKAYE